MQGHPYNNVSLVLDIIRTLSSLAIPVVLIVIGQRLQRKQKRFEAIMSEKLKHYAILCPLINQIFSYRQRVGSFLDRSPEAILEAKRLSDQEFWTFEHLWSKRFKEKYLSFMNESFTTWGEEGTKALIRAERQYYSIPPAIPNWEGFSDEKVDRRLYASHYQELKLAIADDLGISDVSESGNDLQRSVTHLVKRKSDVKEDE